MDLRSALQQSLGPSFTVLRELGASGGARSFVARDSAHARDVVVKVPARDAAGGVSREQYAQNIAAAAALVHPNILSPLAAGEVEGAPYFIMPLAEGETLRARLVSSGERPIGETIRVLRAVAGALAYAHEHGVLHRDIRPDNVLLAGDTAVVTDFGAATSAGTPAYMSPEQARGDATADHRSDIYAFGVLAYEMLTGETPFSGRSAKGMLQAHIAEQPVPVQRHRAGLPPALAALVMQCLAKEPAERPQSAAEIAASLDAMPVPADDIEPLNLLAALESTTVVQRSEYYRNRGVLALTVIVVLSIAGGVFLWRGAQASGNASAPTPTAIAVLPLENVGGDTAAQYFAEGVTDELTSALSKLPGVWVTSHGATAAAFTAEGGDVGKIGDRLRVGAVVEGKVRRVGDRVNLTVRLTGVPGGDRLWSETYDRPATDVVQVEDSAARAIAGALRVTVPAGERLADAGSANARAHDLYLRGRFAQTHYTEADLRRSIDLFQQALREDSTYALAWAGLADAWGSLSDDFAAPSDAMPHMREAVQHGLAIDSTAAELQFSRGVVSYLFDRDARAAQEYMARALAAKPELARGPLWYPQVLWTNGLRDSAAAYLRRTVDRDQASPNVLQLAWTYASAAGNTREERDYCGRLTELHGGERCNALQELDVGQPDRALAYISAAAKAPGGHKLLAQLDYVTALVGAKRTSEARSLVAQVDAEAAAARTYVREDDIALMHGLVGDADGAMRWFERALASKSSGIGALYWRTATNPIRKDPRLAALAKRAGLPAPPPYWP